MKTKPLTDNVAFSCVTDNTPALTGQCFLWTNTLIETLKVNSSNIYVHVTQAVAPSFCDWLITKNINVIAINEFDPRSPHSNKIQQLATFRNSQFTEIVLMDCDTLLSTAEIPVPDSNVAAKIADHPNPSFDIMQAVFSAAGLSPPTGVSTSLGEHKTDRNNCNGGLYIIKQTFIEQLELHWRKWALWLLDNNELLGPYKVHVDQVSFALAMQELDEATQLLPIEWNYPTHLQPESLPDVRPRMIHYHGKLNQGMLLDTIGLENPDQIIGQINGNIRKILDTNFKNEIFWDFRYAYSPKLGSGVGSRGEILAYKQKMLKYTLSEFNQKQVYDLGCGDLELTRALPLANYTGLDISSEAIKIAQQKRPEWKFRQVKSGLENIDDADAMLCFDVLIHQKDRHDFDSLIEFLIYSTRERLIIGAYDRPPEFDSEITVYYESAKQRLTESGQFAEIQKIGQYRDVDIIVADKRNFDDSPYSNEISNSDLDIAFAESSRPDLLRYLVDLSRHNFGFYTRHFPRTLEYPWIAEQLETYTNGCRFLDIGSGLNPLPIYLGLNNNHVDCVDSHPVERRLPSENHWNEWGFFNYTSLHPDLQSYQVDITRFTPDELYDGIYSVSVIEHMPKAIWSKIIELSKSWLKPGGVFLLTLDLVPGTNDLWNRSEGKIVEETSVHGDVNTILEIIEDNGFTISEHFIKRNVHQSQTDIMFLKALVQS